VIFTDPCDGREPEVCGLLGMNLTGALIVVLRVPTNREVNIATPPSAFMHGPPVFAGKYFHVIKEQICQLIGTHLQEVLVQVWIQLF